MHWHGRPRDHSAPRHSQFFACCQLDALRRLQKLLLDAVLIFLPAMVGERGDIVENKAVILRVELCRRFRVSSAPCGAKTVDEPAKRGVIAGFLLRAGPNERQHRSRQRHGHVESPPPTFSTIVHSIAHRCRPPGAPSNPGQEFAGGMSQRVPLTLFLSTPHCKQFCLYICGRESGALFPSPQTSFAGKSPVLAESLVRPSQLHPYSRYGARNPVLRRPSWRQ